MINLANDLDVRCARACRLEILVTDRPMYMIPNQDRAWLLPPPFSSDYGWSHVLEDHIEAHGHTERYAVELMRIVGIVPCGDIMCAVGAFDAWRIIRATPQQRAQAFLAAMKQE